MSEHTPGPWTIIPCSNGGAIVARGDHRNQIAPEADAHLIAAAPDMLAALRLFIAACDTAPPVSLMREINMACEVARAAIAKAEGDKS